MQDELLEAMDVAVRSGDTAQVECLLRSHPALLKMRYGPYSWLHTAVNCGQLKVVQLLLALGADVNELNDLKRTPLNNAVADRRIDIARLLLEHGARVDPGRRIVISAITGPEPNSLEVVKLLCEYGADIHVVYKNDFTGQPMNALSTAIDWGKEDVADFLRSRGAMLPDHGQSAAAAAPRTVADEVVAWFAEHDGPVQAVALVEIVPSEPPISVRVIPAAENRPCVTLFTTGMSAQAMTVPRGQEAYRYAELFIQLPADWPLTRESLADPRFGWPIHWLRSTAKFPHQHGTWLGGPVTIIADEEPPQPIAPNVQFTSMLLLAEHDFSTRDGRTVQLYRLVPLYTEERELEMAQGIGTLLQAFDAGGTPFVVDINRRNVAIGSRR